MNIPGWGLHPLKDKLKDHYSISVNGNWRMTFKFEGEDVGLRQVEEEVWLVSFKDYDIGYFDMESRKVSAIENPFGPKVIGM
ncbi:type II toxin-antitoxin system RelE/ParE family toxin [Polynucleobacter kasalickyi]|uniref:RelE-like toxin of type II toxin-antitoxin system HigB n=1 Tax=Polynucleobacter kasalickyi TaxID=1938817 RepID=A0A1W2CUH0_9BURK|nr:RelE-like toxin of type II toxin-antitoxin system HigB [Polynucleobacter kasalickyi]